MKTHVESSDIGGSVTTRGFRHPRQPWGASQQRPTTACHERHETLLRKREGGLQTLPGPAWGSKRTMPIQALHKSRLCAWLAAPGMLQLQVQVPHCEINAWQLGVRMAAGSQQSSFIVLPPMPSCTSAGMHGPWPVHQVQQHCATGSLPVLWQARTPFEDRYHCQ